MAKKGTSDSRVVHMLESIDLKSLSRPLTLILKRFEGFPWEEDDNLVDELYTALQDLQVLHKQGARRKALILRLRVKIPRFASWRVRAYRPGSNGWTYWNPLEQSYADFVATSPADQVVLHRISQDEYPPADIIRSWCNANLC